MSVAWQFRDIPRTVTHRKVSKNLRHDAGRHPALTGSGKPYEAIELRREPPRRTHGELSGHHLQSLTGDEVLGDPCRHLHII